MIGNIKDDNESGQFIGYASKNLDDDFTPIAVGTTQAACMDLTIQRALAMFLLHGTINVQRRDDVPADIFLQLGKTLDKFCADKGLPTTLEGEPATPPVQQ